MTPEYEVIQTENHLLIGEKVKSEFNDSTVSLKQIYEIIYKEEDHKIYYYMVPWFIFFGEQTVTFNYDKIVCQTVPTDKVVKMYKEILYKYTVGFKEDEEDDTIQYSSLDRAKFN
jgi:hypothetical protein